MPRMRLLHAGHLIIRPGRRRDVKFNQRLFPAPFSHTASGESRFRYFRTDQRGVILVGRASRLMPSSTDRTNSSADSMDKYRIPAGPRESR